MGRSPLDEVPGIGPARKKALLMHFGTARAIKGASREDLQKAPGVAEACLSLQDHHEQNVPLLLWAAWAAVTGRRPDEETIEAACDAARAYDTVIVSQLRAVRRTLKAPSPDMDHDHREALRQQVKALQELLAEQA